MVHVDSLYVVVVVTGKAARFFLRAFLIVFFRYVVSKVVMSLLYSPVIAYINGLARLRARVYVVMLIVPAELRAYVFNL